MSLVNTAKQLVEAGLSVIPVKDGTKIPAVAGWDKYRDQPADGMTLVEWFTTGAHEVGITCGKASGNLEVLDFETEASFFTWEKKIKAANLTDLVDKLPLAKTPRGGRHLYYRVEQIFPGEKLAQDKDGKLLIETRGSNHYVKAPFSKGYSMVRGTLREIPKVTSAQRHFFIALYKRINWFILHGYVNHHPGAGFDSWT